MNPLEGERKSENKSNEKGRESNSPLITSTQFIPYIHIFLTYIGSSGIMLLM